MPEDEEIFVNNLLAPSFKSDPGQQLDLDVAIENIQISSLEENGG